MPSWGGYPDFLGHSRGEHRGNPSAHKPSIVQDLERGRPVELDAMFTVPLEFAKMLNVPVPTLELLIVLMRLRAQGAGLYKG